jgi:hypothetical protein
MMTLLVAKAVVKDLQMEISERTGEKPTCRETKLSQPKDPAWDHLCGTTRKLFA